MINNDQSLTFLGITSAPLPKDSCCKKLYSEALPKKIFPDLIMIMNYDK